MIKPIRNKKLTQFMTFINKKKRCIVYEFSLHNLQL